MALRPSEALRNFLLEGGSLKQALSNCKLKYYTGAQPGSGDAAPTGALLVTFTNAGGAHTAEVLAVGSVDLTGGASGSVNTITVNSIEIMGSATAFNTSLAQTAADIATKINNNPANILFTADVSDTDKVNIRAKPGLGALANGWVVASTVTTITKTDSNMASGVTAVNGLRWGNSADGTLVKDPTQTWQGTAVATGTAGWGRFEAAVVDPGTLDSTESIIRLDGTIATAGGDFNIGNTTITNLAVNTISAGSISLPTA